jgi:hypothetical protein
MLMPCAFNVPATAFGGGGRAGAADMFCVYVPARVLTAPGADTRRRAWLSPA